MASQTAQPANRRDERSLRADAARNREQIVAAAATVFVENGPDAPMDRIAKRAGVGNATLYRRFPDRDVLLAEVATLSVQRLTQVATDLLDEHGPDGLRVLVASADRLTAVNVLHLLTQDQFLALPAADAAQLREAIDNLVQRARSRYNLHPALDATVLLTLIGSTTRPLPAPETVPPASVLLDVLLHGVCPAPGADAPAGLTPGC